MNQSESMSHQAGKVMGQAQEKASNMMGSAGNTTESAKESCQEAGQQMKAKAQGAADAVKNSMGSQK